MAARPRPTAWWSSPIPGTHFKPPGVFGISSGTTSPLLAPCPGEKKPAPQVSPPPKPSRLALAQGGTLAIAHGCPGVQACGATAVVSVASVASTPGDPCRRVQPGDPCRRVVSAQRRRRSRVTKATSFMIQPGKTRKVKLKLNRRGRSLLRRRRLRRVQVSYAPFTVGRKPRVTTRALPWPPPAGASLPSAPARRRRRPPLQLPPAPARATTWRACRDEASRVGMS